MLKGDSEEGGNFTKWDFLLASKFIAKFDPSGQTP